jgi:hypothetical protein
MANELTPVIFIGLFIVAVIAGIIYSIMAAKKRREAFFTIATELGLEFYPGKDHSLAGQYGFLNKLSKGSNRYAENVISGNHEGHKVMLFDYHYETHSTNSKGQRQTNHHHFSVAMLNLPALFPEITITREGIFSKIAQAFGYDDIDFESAEFSKKFCVRSPDKRTAYDVCHGRMMEYLLVNDDLNIEIDGNTLAFLFDSRLKAERIVPELVRLVQIRELIPAHVIEARGPKNPKYL